MTKVPMRFALYEGDNVMMRFVAKDDKHAKEILLKAGVKNKSNIFNLIKEE